MDLSPLFAPISASAPCGPDPEHDAALGSEWYLFGVAVDAQNAKWTEYLNKPADEKPQPPAWAALQQSAYDMAAKTKHLHAAAILSECLALNEGLPGLRDGLALLQRWCTDFWDTLHPGGELDDIQDLRPNCVHHLKAPAVVARMQRLPLVATYETTKGRRHMTAGPYSLGDLQAAKDNLPSPEVARLVLATYAKADQQELKATHAVAVEALELAKALEDVFDRHNCTLDLLDLRGYLSRAGIALKDHLREGTGSPAQDATSESEAPVPGAGPTTAFAGPDNALASRQAAISALQRVISYFEAAEPSSPVPLMLRRAQRCIGKNFMEIVEELGQDRAVVETILKPDAPPSESTDT